MEKRQRKQQNRKQHYDQIRGVKSRSFTFMDAKNADCRDKDNISQAHTKAKQWTGIGKPEKTPETQTPVK
jgi:hypothetical protein